LSEEVSEKEKRQILENYGFYKIYENYRFGVSSHQCLMPKSLIYAVRCTLLISIWLQNLLCFMDLDDD